MQSIDSMLTFWDIVIVLVGTLLLAKIGTRIVCGKKRWGVLPWLITGAVAWMLLHPGHPFREHVVTWRERVKTALIERDRAWHEATNRRIDARREAYLHSNDDLLRVDLRPTPAMQQVSEDELALTIKSLLFGLAAEPPDANTVSMANLQETVVHRDSDAEPIALRDVANLSRRPARKGSPRDVVVEVTANSPALHDILARATQAMRTHFPDWAPEFTVHIYTDEQKVSLRIPAERNRDIASNLLVEHREAPLPPAEPPAPAVAPTSAAPQAPAEPPAPAVAQAPTVAPSVAPTAPDKAAAATPVGPDGLPAWVKQLSHADQGQYHLIVHAGPYVTQEECQRELNLQMTKGVAHYLDELLGPKSLRVLPPLAEIKTWQAGPPVVESIEHPEFGTMYQLHQQLVIDRPLRDKLRERLRQHLVQERLLYGSVGIGLVLATIGTVFGYLRVDTATRGYYRGRLKVAAGAALAAIGGLAALWLDRIGVL
ncbi:MAG: hypothetical protein K1X74_14485 [Pirellulales bacterium]|nr:hypothetical protein [Pirellulales bacterium]